ncbi:MAG TPA: hypothetical protein VFK36_08185 [Gemmatimonadales bacterium]|nr:hypothetical protein [Gemmatimonadales bacterium]
MDGGMPMPGDGANAGFLPPRTAGPDRFQLSESEPPGTPSSQTRPASVNDIVHQTLKGGEVGLGFDYSAIEKEAMGLAQALADKGLPRHDLPATAPIEEEELLANRAREIFRKWVKSINGKMRGALAGELTSAAEELRRASSENRKATSVQRQLEQLQPRERRSDELDGEAPIVPSDESAGSAQVPSSDLPVPMIPGPAVVKNVSITLAARHLRAYWFFPLMALLLLADFFANAPVFAELFPSDRDVSLAVQDWVRTNLGNISWYGLKHLRLELLVHPEPSLLAFSVILFFLWLGHAFGSSLRRFVVSSRPGSEELEASARPIRVQSLWPLGFAGAGIVITLVALYVARSGIAPVAQNRYQRAAEAHGGDSTRLAALVAESESEGLLVVGEQLNQLRQRELESSSELTYRRSRKDYAESIGELNVPILLLNIVLVITAIVAGYHREEVIHSFERLEPGPMMSALPEPAVRSAADEDLALSADTEAVLQPSEDRVEALRVKFRQHAASVTDAVSRASESLNRADELTSVDPYQQWQAVADRLNCMIPMFRAENARRRALDTRDILAFRDDATISFEAPQYVPDAGQVARLKELRVMEASLNRKLAVLESSSRPDSPERRSIGAVPPEGQA